MFLTALRRNPYHSLLFAAYPVLALLASNLQQVEIGADFPLLPDLSFPGGGTGEPVPESSPACVPAG